MKSVFLTIPLLLLPGISPIVTFATEKGTPFRVIGEQLEHPIPKNWKLAWMDGKPDGRFVVEYIPENDDINTWRKGYLAIERLPYPSSEVMQQIEGNISEFALSRYIQLAKERCAGKHKAMSQRTNTFKNTLMSVGGGFCDKYGPAAPFGEGSFVAFVQGEDFLFRVQYGWRPDSTKELNANLPWRISRQAATQYLEAIKASSLCGGTGERECNNRTFTDY